MGDPRIDSLHDPYEDQLSAARFKAERDAAVQELQAMRERNIELWMESGMANELVTCAEQKAERLGKLVWRLQNRLARSHRREKALRKGMRMWREKAISGPVRTVSAYDLLNEDEREVLRMWPRFEETGEPVLFGDSFLDHHGDVRSVLSFEMWQEGGFTLHTGQGTADWNSSGERVKRPAVLAADGEPLEVGQTVRWLKNPTCHLTVDRVDSAKCVSVTDHFDGEAQGLSGIPAKELTHQRPVLDAFGVPIKVGDTVYEVGKNYPPFIVGRLPEPGAYRSVRVVYPSGASTYLDPERLTHTKPEPQGKTCGDCRFWQSDPDASQIGVCWNSYAERDSYDSYEARVKHANACEVFEERGE